MTVKVLRQADGSIAFRTGSLHERLAAPPNDRQSSAEAELRAFVQSAHLSLAEHPEGVELEGGLKMRPILGGGFSIAAGKTLEERLAEIDAAEAKQIAQYKSDWGVS